MPAAVLILLASYNGARWLPDQLASIAAQDLGDWALWVSDDGSADATRQVVRDFAAARAGRNEVRLVDGPKTGTAAGNFLHLLARPDLPLGPRTHVAFADQDDVWRPEKLSRALERLAAVPEGTPALYGAQSRHIDEDGRPCGRSRRPRRPVELGNAVVQNLVSGHSAVLSPAGAALARVAGAPPGVVFHDWWLSQLLLAAGGEIVIDEAEVLDYRQHGGNTLGAPVGLVAFLVRARQMLGRDFAGWMAANLAGLAAAGEAGVPLTPEARALLAGLAAAPRAGPGRAARLRRLGVHRQSALGSTLLWTAAMLGRV